MKNKFNVDEYIDKYLAGELEENWTDSLATDELFEFLEKLKQNEMKLQEQVSSLLKKQN